MQVFPLVDFLSEISDFRRSQGLRYPLWVVLTMVIMAIISGSTGYREFSRFMKANKASLVEVFALKHGVPSHVTIRHVLMQLDLDKLKESFNRWMNLHVPAQSGAWMSIDGKSLGSTVSNPHNSLQNFVWIVSVFAHQSGLVHGIQSFHNGKSYEPEIVRQLIQSLGLKDVTLTLDALHCQKKL